MEQKISKVSKGNKASATWGVIGLMIQNFFIWFIPGVIVLAISLVVLLILLLAAATGVEINFYKWMPKGLVSFLGIAYLLVGIAFVVLIFIVPDLDAEGIIYLIGATIICWILSYVGLKMEFKRLSKKIILDK